MPEPDLQTLKDYSISVANPHLRDTVLKISARKDRNREKVTVKATLTARDHKKATDLDPARRNLQTVTSNALDLLSANRYGWQCNVTFAKDQST